MSMLKSIVRLAMLAPLALMAACGGGSSDNAKDAPITPPVTQSATLAFALANYSVAPSAGTVTLIVNRNGAGAASVAYSTIAGTAKSGTDYTNTSGTLTWAAGDSSSKAITVPITTSGVGGKAFTVGLSAASGATLATPIISTVNISLAPIATAWSAEVWSAAYSSPASLGAVQSKSPAIIANNGAVYYARMNAWNSGAGGFRDQRTWSNNEHDWGVSSNHVNDGQVKSYSSVVRGWATGEGFNGITNSGLGIQISALTKVHMRWAFTAPTDFGGVTGANATNRVNVLWDTYFHTKANPGANDLPDISLMINQYDVDGDGYYGGLAQQGTLVTLGGQQWRMYVFHSSWASGNTIELFPGPFPNFQVFGTQDLTIDYLGVVRDLVTQGLIPNTDYLTSIQAGYEIIAGGVFRTTQFWTAVQSEADGTPTPPSGGTAPIVTLNANPASVTSGQSSMLTWNTINAASCTASGAWSGTKATSGSQATGALTASSTYTLNCTGTGGGSASASTTVTVNTTSTPAPTVTLSASPMTVASGASSTLTWTSTNATSCTASGAWSGTKSTSGSQTTGALTATGTYTITCTGAGGTTPASTTVSISGTPQAGNCGGTTANVSWVYYNGAMSSSWPHDYSFGSLVANYSDTSGVPLSGAADIQASGPPYAGWQPASLNYTFDISGCNYLTFALKPTRANQTWSTAFLYVGDVPTGVVLNIGANGSVSPTNPVVGAWNVYKIPLSNFFPNGVVPQTIYKFFLQDTLPSNGGNNTWYIDNVGFTGN